MVSYQGHEAASHTDRYILTSNRRAGAVRSRRLNRQDQWQEYGAPALLLF